MRLFKPLAAILVLALAACGEPKADEAFGQKVRAYLLEHPEVLQEAYEKLQVKQQQAALLSAAKALAENRQALENDPRDFVANPNGKITVVEFFDYNCGYCKLIAPEVLALVKARDFDHALAIEVECFDDRRHQRRRVCGPHAERIAGLVVQVGAL